MGRKGKPTKAVEAPTNAGKSSKLIFNPLLMSTIESDEEVAASASDQSEDESEAHESSIAFTFDDETVYGGDIKPGAKVASWDFKTAIQTLSDQGAKKPFELLSAEHIEAKRKAANKRIKAERKVDQAEAALDEMTAKAKHQKVATESEAGEGDGLEEVEDDADEESDEEDVSGDGDDDDDDDDDEGDDHSGDDDDEEEDDEEDEDDEDDDKDEDDGEDPAPEGEDELRELTVSAAELAAQQRAERKRSREGGGKGDDEDAAADAADEKGGARNTVDDDQAAADFFDTYSSFLPGGAGGAGGAGADPEVLFSQLNLSRPLMRGVESMGFTRPTPIQARVIPIALAGRDVCGSAVTGSGKTAAFLLPVMERLLYRPMGAAATRVLIVAPTRELAAQCHAMAEALSRFCDPPISVCLITGGTKNLRPQEAELRRCPDMVVCTPGRMLDHLRNSPGVHVDELSVLVLDEVDRLLELGFKDEMEELVRLCPTERQTLLFSATMNTTVEQLVSLSLKRPVRVGVDVQGHVAGRLNQEFIRMKDRGHQDRAATLCALVTRTFTTRCIVFFDTKVDAHRFFLLLGLLGVKCAELHGNLTQIQRLEALEKFRAGGVDVLLATDLAARGLDIPTVQTVINYEMPRQPQTYVHRVGRTARAGRSGRSVTLIGEGRRLVMKEVLRGMDAEQRAAIKTRAVPPVVLDHFRSKVVALKGDVEQLLVDEQELKELRVAEMHLNRASNVLEKEDEIAARPARTWFQSERMKENAKEASKKAVDEAALRPSRGPEKTPAQRLKLVEKSEKKGQGAGGGKVETGTHRLSRKKRRRLEKLASMDREMAEQEADEAEARRARRGPNGGEGDDDDAAADARLTKRTKVSKALANATESQAVKKAEAVGKAAKRKLKAKQASSGADDGDGTAGPLGGKAGKKGKKAALSPGDVYALGLQRSLERDLAGGGGEGGGEGLGGEGFKKPRRRVKVVLQGSSSYDQGEGETVQESGGKASKDGKGGADAPGAKKAAAGPFGFTEFDPRKMKTKKQRKNANQTNKFKSKAKFKRR